MDGLHRMSSLVRWSALCAATLLPGGIERAFAGEIWSWHAVDATVLKTSKAEVILHGRLRTGRSFGTLQQGRTGVITKFGIPRNATAIGGYYYGKEEDSAEDWRNFHRMFIGIEAPLHRSHGLRLDTRGIVERFFVVDHPQFSRYRHRIRLRSEGRVGPYFTSEWFFDANGYLSSRHGAGVRWKCAERGALEIGYLYDARRSTIGEPRHVIVTQVTLDRLWR